MLESKIRGRAMKRIMAICCATVSNPTLVLHFKDVKETLTSISLFACTAMTQVFSEVFRKLNLISELWELVSTNESSRDGHNTDGF